MEIDLPFIWAGIIAFAILAYVIMDGFDLGIGILFPVLTQESERDLAINEKALGATHPLLAPSLINLALTLADLQRFVRAAPLREPQLPERRDD